MKGNLKKAIVVVVLAALTLAAFNVFLVPNVKANVSEVKVLSYNWYVAPSNTALAVYIGDLVAVGEVQNVGSNNLNFVVVGGIAYNSAGDAVASTESQVFSNHMLPGGKAPFYLDFTPQTSVTQDQSWVPSVTNVTVSVTFVNDTTATHYSGLTIPTGATTSYVDNNFAFTVAGLVKNTGNETTGNVWVVTTFYNATGYAVGMNFTDYLTSTGSLAPGASVPFTATPVDNTPQLSSQITNYSLEIQSNPLSASPSPSPSTSPSTQPTLSPNASPSASVQPSQTPSGPQPSGSNGLIYAVVVAVVIVVVVIAVLVFLRKRGK